MPDTDIYKNNERIQTGAEKPQSRKGRRRRSASLTAFDETGDRRRRSKNSGIRRLLHLSRKSSNEKSVWWGLLVAIVVVMLVIALWQFVYLEYAARKQTRQEGLYVPIQTSESAAE